jgi:hypothetical protein
MLKIIEYEASQEDNNDEEVGSGICDSEEFFCGAES